MKLVQYKGPFYQGSTITIPPQINYTYVHIGIQTPKVQPMTIPITKISNDGKKMIKTSEYRAVEPLKLTKIKINNKDYIINENSILEFDDLAEIEWVIRFEHSFPPETIIDVVWT